ncbi:PREDICTED: uncharacterized protein LOC109174911 [Ipomoea nil]|uniref:uncharacterized protein LOC109174911 n=1 Tax=Ipomoea nil TaxID=35883 RepID=UPI000901E8EC|nr:PREDICTED: uncharacterized protein LOC109174911 [Ipomoea nil]
MIQEVTRRNQIEVQAITLRSGKSLKEEKGKTVTPSRDDIPCNPKDTDPSNNRESKDVEEGDDPAPTSEAQPSKKGKEIATETLIALKPKKRLEETATIVFGEECSALLHKEILRKLKDPGSFTILCNIGESKFNKALADLGASINLIPYGLYKKLKLGVLKPTRICIQLADRSTKYPRGIVDDVLVRADKFIFPVDFIILDMDPDVEVPLILGRPFLATARALIDVGSGKLVIHVGGESASFDVTKLTKYPLEGDDACFYIDHPGSDPDYLLDYPSDNDSGRSFECPLGGSDTDTDDEHVLHECMST